MIALIYYSTIQKAAEAGSSMAKSINAEVILIHVNAEPVYYPAPNAETESE